MATRSSKTPTQPARATSRLGAPAARHDRLVAFTDGGARGNPGPAALGVAIYGPDQQLIAEFGEYLGHRTNNQAEYAALLKALREAKRLGATHLAVYMDSELIVKQMAGEYRVKNPDLRVLFAQAKELTGEFARVTFAHVRRERNRAADRLVNRALDHAAAQGA